VALADRLGVDLALADSVLVEEPLQRLADEQRHQRKCRGLLWGADDQFTLLFCVDFYPKRVLSITDARVIDQRRSLFDEEGKSAPSLRDAFDAFENPIARGSESWIGSDVFMDGFAITWRLGRRLNAEARRGLDMWFGAWHLPTRSDVDRLSGQIAALERQVRDLRTELEQSDPPSLRLGKIPRRRPVSRGLD
jgi:hypothetical protein